MINNMTSENTTAGTIWNNITEHLNKTGGSNCSEPIPPAWGYVSAALTVVLYGSNYVPVKNIEAGDGMFFQWIYGTAILFVGIVVHSIRNSEFYPLVMLGGVAFATGQICIVPILKTIGLSLGMCIWAMLTLLSGWATNRFGLFGLQENIPDNPTMNYIGVAVALSSTIVFAWVRKEIPGPVNRAELHYVDETTIDKLTPGWKRIIGIVLAIVAGILFGQLFTVSTYYLGLEHTSKNALDYVFACFCGIYLTSMMYLIVYILIMKNQPRIYPKLILPAMISGALWGAATVGWFVANRVLSETVAFPIILAGPPIIASMWGVLVFREIKGPRNLSKLLLGIALAVTGSILAGMSQKPREGC